MFWTPVIETIISLIFTFLILSVICSAIYEWISERRNLRGQLLAEFLIKAFNDPTERLPNFGQLVLRHPMIRSGAINEKRQLDKIDPEIFANVFTEVSDQCILNFIENTEEENLAFSSVPEGVFKSLNYQNGASLAILNDENRKEKIINWYQSLISMIRYQYKQKTRKYLFMIGLVFAIAFNVDTIHLIDRYWTDSALRDAMVSAAENYMSKDPEEQPSTISMNELIKELPVLNTQRFQSSEKGDNAEAKTLDQKDIIDYLRMMPVGWDSFRPFEGQKWGTTLLNLLLMFVGWVITAMAVTFGAPFWYDVLRQLFNIRTLKSN